MTGSLSNQRATGPPTSGPVINCGHGRRCRAENDEVLEAVFVRHPGRRVRIYVQREDGTGTGWDFPGTGDGLPHDLCHLVIEAELGMTDGFWELVDQGAEVGLVDNQSALMRNGRPLSEDPRVDFSGLVAAEAAVVVLTGHPLAGADLEDSLAKTEAARSAIGVDAAERIPLRLAELAEQWNELEDGGSLRLWFPAVNAR